MSDLASVDIVPLSRPKPFVGAAPAQKLSDLEWLGETIPWEALEQPATWYVLLKQVNVMRRTAGGILLTDQSVEANEWNTGFGLVLRLGPGVYRGAKFEGLGITPDMAPKPGEVWEFRARGGAERRWIDGEAYMLMADDGLIARCDPDQMHRIRFKA